MIKKVALRVGFSVLIGILLAWVINELSYRFLKTDAAREPKTIVLTIPAETSSRISRGRNDQSIPEGMTFVLGDTLIIDNQDRVNHQLGPVFIPPGSKASMKLETAGKLSYECSFVAENTFGIDVQLPVTIETRLLGAVFAGLPMGALIALYSMLVGAKSTPVGRGSQ